MSDHRFPYRWNLSDGYPTEQHGLKVFSTFACGGGSTMGYKLAGYDVLGCLEIDPQIIEVYKKNHRPRFVFCEDIRTFRKRDDLPPELFDLDILDGSPPCSTFSMSGNRQKDWGKEKHFREGQSKQRLDDLFFDFIKLAEKLQPKVVIAENVKGMITGKAKGYVKEIAREFRNAGYRVQLFLLNAASMGVPQKRERVFFVCSRDDLDVPPLRLVFNEPTVSFGEATAGFEDIQDENTTKSALTYWHRTPKGRSFGEASGGGFFNWIRLDERQPCNTIASACEKLHHPTICRPVNDREVTVCGTFPLDYDFGNVDPKYLIGMSVPPVMVAQIATKIRDQWFSDEVGASPTPALQVSAD